MSVTLDRFCDRLMGEPSNRRKLEAAFVAEEFVRFFGVSSRPTLEEIKVLLEEIGAGTVVARHLPGGLRGAHIRMGDGGYVIHHIPDDWRGATEHTLMHETYEIIYETLYGSYEDPATARRVCREANRFAAAVLMPAAKFEEFAVATGLDILSLQRRFQCSYASVALRLGEVMSRRPLLAVLYERRENGDPWTWCPAPEASDFRASVVVRTPGVEARDSRMLCGARGRMPRRGNSPHLGSMAARVALAGGSGYAEKEPAPGGGGGGDYAMVVRPVTWWGRVVKVALVAVPYSDRSVLSPQLTAIPASRRGPTR